MLFLLLFLLLSACAAPARADLPDPPEGPAGENTPAPAENAPPEAGESEDHVLLTLKAPLADGRTLTLEAVGKTLDEYTCGVREVRVYDGNVLIQTVPALEAIEVFWGDGDLLPGEEVSSYTSCWSPEETMEALDLNFDGDTGFGLFGWAPNNTIPYYYWIWDADAGRYEYACTLQGAEVHPEAKQLTAEYKSGSAGSQWIVEYYTPDENGDLCLDRVERDTCGFEPENGYLDYNRGGAHEVWTPPEAIAPIRPGSPSLALEADLVLTRREVPVCEGQADNAIAHFTEIWERKDGELQMTSREEFFYDVQQ